ncbi:MAG: 16S rRNA (uracil(1498)-N(3))-methyltransferase [Treponema sp.]|jgi:16S rRNA (uracil1498-N3)-methyltransferase|nr:16S rRNA (uracil(1498)-N(3))-methyltransferase [Treponema sp.]
MKQFILREAPDKAGLIHLSGDDYHYLARVRRLKPGAEFAVLLPGGERAAALVESVGGKTLTARTVPAEISAQKTAGQETSALLLVPPVPVPIPALPPLVLFQALPKGAKMDMIVRQAAEGGVSRIIPFMSEFSVYSHSGSEPEPGGRTERWRRIIREARQQSRSLTATEISPPHSFDNMLAAWKLMSREPNNGRGKALGFLMREPAAEIPAGESRTGGRGLAQHSFHRYLCSDCSLAALAVGPEGGFSEKEVKSFLDAGFYAVTIGETILRTETAALYGSAAIRILLLEKATWTAK